ncbi:uncharacterized protein LOC144587233 isoform X2 [Pogona vitticeps]
MEVWSRKEVPGRTAQMNPDGDSPSSDVQRRHFGRFGCQEDLKLPTRPGSSEWVTSKSVCPRRRPRLLKNTEEKGARAGVPDPGINLGTHRPSSVLHGGMETRSMKPEQVAEALEELAVDFSEEEWALLDPGQRALHREVMEETLTDAASLSIGMMLERHPSLPLLFGKVERTSMPPDLMKTSQWNSAGSFSPSGMSQKLKGVMMTFEDIAVHFTEEEWALLDEGERALHRDIMEENIATLISLATRMREERRENEENTVCLGADKEKKRKEPFKNDRSFKVRSRLPSDHQFHSAKKPLQCLEGETASSQTGDRSSHQRILTGETQLKCLLCGENFNQFGNLASHMRIHNFKCLECGKSFRDTYGLALHMRIHTREKTYKCLDCGKSFCDRRSLVCHKKIHTAEEVFKCLECGKTFGYSGDLSSHLRIHRGETQLKCLLCGKGFSHFRNLACHMKIHSFKCVECGKGFRDTQGLASHMRIHTDEKPLKCLECGKGFIHSGNLSRHMRTHTGEKP